MFKSTLRHPLALLLASTVSVACWAPHAFAASSERQNYDLPVQPLGISLRAIATASGRDILAASVASDQQAPALKGSYTADEAVNALLAGSGLRARRVGKALVIEAVPVTSGGDAKAGDIVVTGSRIPGAAVASPVIVIDRERIKSDGQSTLPEALRALPQNFGGGQNPGVGQNVPEGTGFDLGGGSSINLRGLGSDATLTLLNGHRLSYNAAKESVDISGIPLGAISRIDVVPDGASALFGSDAIAGVVNIILRHDLNGLETGFRLAGTTDGGDFTQIYNVTGGKTWTGGSALVAYEYGSNTPIISSQRDYASIRPNLTIFPGLRHHSGLLALRQDISSNVAFSIDGLFNERWSSISFPLNLAGDLSVSRATSSSTARSYGFAPSLTLALASDWQLSLTGSYGQDKVNYGAVLFFGTTALNLTPGYYRNGEKSLELSSSGSLFELPGGRAKVALGVGYRRIDFVRFTGVGGAQNIERSQSDFYGFGELSLPVAKSVVLSAAARYEHYWAIGQVLTPKLGMIVSPTPDVSLKGSWGTSFRAPTLYEQYQPQSVILVDIASVGGTGHPAGTTALVLNGGNPKVTPEKSTNWAATLDYHPRSLAGFSLELSYFAVDYRDRIVIPLPSQSVALANPLYASRVTNNPSIAAQTTLISSVGTFINLSSNSAYDPSLVAAIVDDSNVNAGSQTVRGLDILARYESNAGPGKVSGSIDAAYITSKQQIGPGLPVTRLAGAIFNPPHVRVRGDLAWTVGPVTFTGAASYIGPVDDNRTPSVVRVDGMTPIDLSVRYHPSEGPLKGLDLIASTQNLFNNKPTRIATNTYTDAAYDSTNYSPIGRLLSLSVSKKW